MRITSAVLITLLAPPALGDKGTNGTSQFLPEPDVTRDNWLKPPQNRYAFKHISTLQHMAVMTKGSGIANALPGSEANYDLLNLNYTARDDPNPENLTWTNVTRQVRDMLNRTYTDGIVILHKGKIVLEEYFDGQTENTRHIIFSCTKSYAGLLAAMLAHEGLLKPDALVIEYVPEMQNSALADATVREVMDMSTSFVYREDYDDMTSEVIQHSIAAGVINPPRGYEGPRNLREFLTRLEKGHPDDKHDEAFTYRSANTDVLSWIVDRVLGGNGKSIEDFTNKLWSKLGQEHDAMLGVDPTHFPNWFGFATVTARDMARFGEMMRNGGKSMTGEQLVPQEVVEDIMKGGTELNVKQFAKSDEGAPGQAMEGWAYRNQYWVKPNHIFCQVGIFGQFCCVDTKANLVIAKQSSFPSATGWVNDDETLQAFFALGEFFQSLNVTDTDMQTNITETKGSEGPWLRS